MADVDFSDIESATVWFETQSREMRFVMASRATLRVMPYIGDVRDGQRQRMALKVLRAHLITAVSGLPQTAKIGAELQAAAHSAANDCLSAATDTAERLALSAASAVRAIDTSYAARAVIAAIRTIGDDRNAATIATEIDSGFTAKHLMGLPAWSARNTPENIFNRHSRFIQSLYGYPEWEFWARWYRGMWDGTFRDWDLATKVALIPNEVWDGEDAVAKVARKIDEIERNLQEKDALPPNVIKAQSAALFENASANGIAASGLQQFINTATSAYLREVENALPEALEPLGMLPGILDRIASILNSSTPQSQRETELEDALRLAANTVADLNRRLSQAQQEISALKDAADAGTPRRLFADAFYKTAGEGTAGLITSKTLWASIIMGSSVLFGGSADALVEQLGQCYEGIIAPEAPDVLPRLPHDTQI
ncbi:hypothetical protein KUV51_20180 [Tateyamaria omphalii]|uniref:hypothetical protein n=1 Tax=Tateyamaria omphalii TaxID=299262 RepID=UPI001C994EB0|nr:hypothetical protein [Tateyamaria omphalii]MBY5935336.1 hypothetical protein [Tateyamaria omphalii]